MNSTRVLPNSEGSANETRKYKLFWSALAPLRHARVKVAMSVELIYNTIGMLPLQSVGIPLLESQHDGGFSKSTESFQLISPNCTRSKAHSHQSKNRSLLSLTLRYS